MTTVLTLPGAFSYGDMATVQAALGGPQAVLEQLGDTSEANVVGVPYDDWDTIGGAQDGANRAAAALTAVPAGQRAVVIGHSYGAVAISQLLRTPAKITIDPSLVTFVCCANSIRLNNGLSTMMGLYGPGGGPVSTRFRVYDLARQFDKWADQPNVYSSPDYWQASGNCNTGDTATATVGGVPNNIHNSYQGVRLNDPAAAQATIGAVTFMLFETDPPPNASGVSRAQLETAYNRVVQPTW